MRISVARRNLFKQRFRFAMSVGSVGLSVTLVLFAWGVYSSFKVRIAEYLSSIPADVWVGQAGVPAVLMGGISTLPVAEADGIAAIEGVESVHAFSGRILQYGDKQGTWMYVTGVDPEDPITAPRHATGRRVPGRGEIVIDKSFARNNDIRLAQTMDVVGHKLRVVGISEGTDFIGTGFAFVDSQTANRIFETSLLQVAPEMVGSSDQLTSFFAVRTSAPAEVVKRRIQESSRELNPMTKAEFIEENVAQLRRGVEPIIWILVMICFGVGAAVTGLTIYTATIEKSKEYGVLKAIGFTNGKLLRVIGSQSLIATVVGFAVGGIFQALLTRVVTWVYPVFSSSLTTRAIIGVALLCLVMSTAAALVPARRIATIDPAQVFRA